MRQNAYTCTSLDDDGVKAAKQNMKIFATFQYNNTNKGQ